MKFAVITLTYAPDLFRFKILSESIQKYLLGDYCHYVIVDKQDLKSFMLYCHSENNSVFNQGFKE